MKSFRAAWAAGAFTMRYHGILCVAVLAMSMSDCWAAQGPELQTQLQAVIEDPVT